MKIESLLGVSFDRYASMSAGGYYFTELCPGHAALTLRENYGVTEDEETGEEEEGLGEISCGLLCRRRTAWSAAAQKGAYCLNVAVIAEHEWIIVEAQPVEDRR